MPLGLLGRLARLAALLGLVALFVLLPARPASAHAELSTSDPADGAVVEEAPGAISLQFTEGVAVQPDGIRVLDADGDRVDAGNATASGDTVTAPVDGSLADGGYVVAWRVVSADGHPVRGAFSFSVGARADLPSGLADEAFAGSADRRDDVAGAVLRFLGYVGVLGATGAVLVGAALRRDDEPSPVGRVATGLAALGLGALVLQLPVQASLATGQGWGSITDEGVLELTLADGVGWSIALTGAGLVALMITTGLPFRGAARFLAVVGAVLAPLGLVVTGHTRTMSPAAVGYLADGAHVLAGAVWFGGLGALLAAVRRRRRAGDARGAGEAVARFSGWAAVSVGAVAVAGSVLGWIEVGGLDALTSTSYGRLLMLKVALVALVLAGAAWNRYRLVPRLDAVTLDPGTEPEPDPEPGAEPGTEHDVEVHPPAVSDEARVWGQLLRIVRFEVVAIVAVLAVTSVLANVTPAKDAAGGGLQTVSAPLGDGTVEVVVDPASPGRNDVHAYLLDAEDRPDDSFDAAAFQLALPAQDIGPLDREPVRAGPGHFQLVGTDLDLAGEWTLTVTVKPDRFTEQTATVTFRVR